MTAPPTAAERLAGFVTGLVLLAFVAVGLALTQPYSLVFVLPSLYAWLWLPLDGRFGWRVGLYLVGLSGPIVGLVLLGRQLEMSPVDAPFYVIGLFTVGYLPLVSALLGLAWVASAAQLAAVAFGRYSPYAGGAARPPGPLRRVLSRSA
jgi:hypothetical protein